MKFLAALILGLTLIASSACAGESPASTPDLGATVEAAVSSALPTETPTPLPDINATITAGMDATREAEPTATPTPQPTPDIDATVEARMAATIAAVPTPTNTPLPTDTPIPTATPTPTPVPTATPRPTPTPTATPTPTPVPTATPRPTSTPRPTPTPRPTATPTPNPAALLSEMVKRARPAVVRIETRTGSGSGAIFETQGQTAYVITNQHVVEGASEVNVTVNDSSTYRGTVLGTDSVRDLAVVRICCGSFRKLAFGDASRLEPGDEVVAIGYALGLSGQATITRGIVSAIRYEREYLSDVIQTDAAINPGNSGGPMLSMTGQILGINTFGYDETDSGRSVQGVNFAISETTVQARIPVLKTAQAATTPTPTRRPQPTPTRSARPTPSYGGTDSSFGPISGELRHDPSDGQIKAELADVDISDFVISATFVNPYSAESNDWDYGFGIRDSGTGSSRRLILVLVTSEGYWDVGESKEISSGIQSGRLSQFNTDAGGQNTLWLAAVGGRGLFFVNGDFVSELDLSDVTTAGDVAVITGAYIGGEVAGAVTRFEDFQGGQLQKEYGPAHGRLEFEQGLISEHDSGVWTRDLVAESEFISPSGYDWDYGFIIRNPDFNRLEVVGVDGRRRWFHQTRDVSDAEYTEVANGYIPSSNFHSRNHLLLIALNDWGLFFVNGHLVARLELSHNLDYGGVSVIGGYYNDHTGEPSFENFNVWVP